MFIELSTVQYEKMKPLLDQKNIQYTVKDCSILQDETRHYHLTFEYDVDLAKDIYEMYRSISIELKVPYRTNKWLEKYHNPIEETTGYITGASTEETYDR